MADVEKFTWTVRESEGYFQLGEACGDDDYYILNSTIISASYLHALWDGKSPRKRGSTSRKEDHFWQVKYVAYGCEICSEPFQLGTEDISRRTFIGDQATARIRANGRLFFEYLRNSCLEFQVVRYSVGGNNELINPEVMGLCYVSLDELCGGVKQEFRVQMDVLTEWGTSKAVSIHEKPEVRAMFSLETIPNYFAIKKSLDEEAEAEEGGEPTPAAQTENAEVENDENVRVNSNSNKIMKTKPNPVALEGIQEEDVADGSPGEGPDAVDADAATKQKSPPAKPKDISFVRRLLQFNEVEQLENGDTTGTGSVSLTTHSPIAPNRNNEIRTEQDNGVPSSDKQSTGEIEDSDSDDISPEIAELMPAPGQYQVEIELERFWLKSSRQLEDHFAVRYKHPPIGMDEPMEFGAKRWCDEDNGHYQGFVILKKQLKKKMKIQKYSEKLLNQPMTVSFYKSRDGETPKCFATAMVPFGRTLIEKETDNVREFSDRVDILKSNNAKIGVLYFKISLRRLFDSDMTSHKRHRNAGLSPRNPDDNNNNEHQRRRFNNAYIAEDINADIAEDINADGHDGGTNGVHGTGGFERNLRKASQKYVDDVDYIDKVTDQMREWTRTQEEMYKRQKEEKETAYLQILSQEAAKRDAERDAATSKKLAELEEKEKELNQQIRETNAREERLRRSEQEMKDRLRELDLERESMQHHADLQKRRMEEDNQIKLDSLTRKAQSYKDDIEKLSTKVVILEKKLEAKEDEIDKMVELKRKQPDSKLSQRVATLESEIKMLSSQLREANSRKEQYKGQVRVLCDKVNALQSKRDQEMRDLNENLRLQILATKEHKDLKKERKAVNSVANTIKALRQDSTPSTATIPGDGRGDQGDFPSTWELVKQYEVKKLEENLEKRKVLSQRSQLLSAGEKETEMRRLQTQRKELLNSGAYTQYDAVIKEIEERMIQISQSDL